VFTPALTALVGTGEVLSLQHTIEPGIPVPSAHVPLVVAPYLRHGDAASTFATGGGFASEITIMGQHTGTHIDGLSHFHKRVGDVDYLYGGVPAPTLLKEDEHTLWGAEEMPAVIGRAVLIDIARSLGHAVLPGSFEISVVDIEACMAAQASNIVSGDIVLLRTGYATYWPDSRRFLSMQPGIGLEAAKYLEARGVVAVGSDTATVEVLPTPDLPVHEHLLVEAGIPLIECLDLEEVSERRAYSFLFIAAPLKIKGATGSVINPLAIL
jgi:kynurenine formamidase